MMRIPEGIDPQSFVHGQMNAYTHSDTRKERREIVAETEAAIRADERERLAKAAESYSSAEGAPSTALWFSRSEWIEIAQFIRSQGDTND